MFTAILVIINIVVIAVGAILPKKSPNDQNGNESGPDHPCS
jgi:hypothetical protein